MPSLFGRSKASSTSLAQEHNVLDEFGTLNDSTPARRVREKDTRGTALTLPPSLLVSTVDLHNGHVPSTGGHAHLPDGTYFSTFIPIKDPPALSEYGYISTDSDVYLGLEDVLRLVNIVDHELSTRGLKEPLLFSTKALDVAAARVRSLVRSFLETCSSSNSPDPGLTRTQRDIDLADIKFRQEASFAGPHELAMFLKWGLARIARVKNGFEVRGFLDIEDYLTWRTQEEDAGFPPDAIRALFLMLPKPTHPLVTELFSLLMRFCAYSSSSGLTPPALASHFGPLIFGIGPSSLPFGQAYKLYLRSSHATEHLLLAYTQNSDYEAPIGVELPTRLKDWITGYPGMLPRTQEDLEKPRHGARLIPIASIRRNVRLYSSDLVATATTWCGSGEHTGRKEWKRVVPSHSGEYSKPQYTDEFKKLLNLPKLQEPKIQYDLRAILAPTASVTDFSSNPPKIFRNPIDDAIARSHPELSSSSSLSTIATNEDRFKNLADLQWTLFSESGFKAPNSKLLQFDLGETARRNARNIRHRDAVSWSDFSQRGFDQPAPKPPRAATPGGEHPLPLLPVVDPLAEVLQFSVPIENPTAWSEHSIDLTRRLKKQQKELPSFGWETGAVAGRDWLVEEGMISTWAEYCLSSGWMDRSEGTFREANWALIEFKALPESGARPISGRDGVAPDPRSGSQWFLIEEFVPREYRDDLVSPKKKKPLFASLNKKDRKWHSASTMNGQPYVGRPRSPNPRDIEFDAMLRHSESTTKLSLSTSRKEKGKDGRDTRPLTAASIDDQTQRSSVAPPPLSRSRTTEAVLAQPTPVMGMPAPNAGGRTISGPLYVPPRSDSKDYNSGNSPSKSRPSVPPPISLAQAAPFHHPYATASATLVTPSKTPGSLARFRPGKSKAQVPAAEWDASIEFETRTESDSSSGELSPKPEVPPRSSSILGDMQFSNGHRGGGGRRAKPTDSDGWVDIVLLEHDTNGVRRLSKASPDKARGDIQRAIQDVSPAIDEKDREEIIRSRVPRAVTPPGHSDNAGVNSSLEPVASPQNSPPRVVPMGPRSPGSTPLQRVASPRSSPPAIGKSSGGKGPGGVSSLIEMYQKKEEAALATIPPALLPVTPPIIPSRSPSRIPISINTLVSASSGVSPSRTPPAEGIRPTSAASSIPSIPSLANATTAVSPTLTTPISRSPSQPTNNSISTLVKPMSPARVSSPQPQHAEEQTSPASVPVPPRSDSLNLPISAEPTVTDPAHGPNYITPDDASDGSFEPFQPPPPLPLEPMRVPSPGRYIHGAPLTNVIEDEEEEEEGE